MMIALLVAYAWTNARWMLFRKVTSIRSTLNFAPIAVHAQMYVPQNQSIRNNYLKPESEQQRLKILYFQPLLFSGMGDKLEWETEG